MLPTLPIYLPVLLRQIFTGSIPPIPVPVQRFAAFLFSDDNTAFIFDDGTSLILEE